jgi:hypothetical protein
MLMCMPGNSREGEDFFTVIGRSYQECATSLTPTPMLHKKDGGSFEKCHEMGWLSKKLAVSIFASQPALK